MPRFRVLVLCDQPLGFLAKPSTLGVSCYTPVEFRFYPATSYFPLMMNGTRTHWAHLVLEALTRIDASNSRDAYERLRGVYNSCCPPRSVPVPPLEEWQGLSSICKGFSCRYDFFSKPNRLLAGSGAGVAFEVKGKMCRGVDSLCHVE